jgi:peptide deformylase
MTPLKILTWPNPMLKTRCIGEAIPEGLIPTMFRLMREHRGLGLAAPQVGVDARVFVTAWGEVFLNPVILAMRTSIITTEGCLSFPGMIARRQRWLHIQVGNRNYSGEQAIVIQHELDHLDGITLGDPQ